jgi:hypothetical protein
MADLAPSTAIVRNAELRTRVVDAKTTPPALGGVRKEVTKE